MAEYIEKHKAVNLLTSLENEFQQFKPFKGFENAMYRKLCETEIAIGQLPAVDVVPVVHGRCPICSGQKILTQDCDNGYSVEVDAEFGEMSIWQGDTCLTVISIDYCPNCGAKLDGGAIDG